MLRDTVWRKRARENEERFGGTCEVEGQSKKKKTLKGRVACMDDGGH